MCVFVLIGLIFAKTKFFSKETFAQLDRFVFKIALPSMVFLDVLECDVSDLTDLGLIGFTVVGITLSVIVLMITVPIFEKSPERRGAVVQGIYRSNFAVLGSSLASEISGDAGTRAMAVVMPFTIVLFNAYAVVVLSVFNREEHKSPLEIIKTVTKNIVTNPLIIGTVSALVLVLLRELLKVDIPILITSVAGKLSDTVYALALMGLGASLTVESFGNGRLKTAVTASVFKTVILPLIMVTIAVLMGFRGARLCVLFVLFGAPTALSSYIMAKNMKSDAELAGQILLVSTVMSVFTIFAGVFIMKNFGFV